MTDTNLNRAAQMAGFYDWAEADRRASLRTLRLIQAHAATLDELDAAKAELEAFKREVSDYLTRYYQGAIPSLLKRFILPNPDPLVEVVNELGFGSSKTAAADLRVALAKHGLKLERNVQ